MTSLMGAVSQAYTYVANAIEATLAQAVGLDLLAPGRRGLAPKLVQAPLLPKFREGLHDTLALRPWRWVQSFLKQLLASIRGYRWRWFMEGCCP